MPNALAPSGGVFRSYYSGQDDAAAQQQQNALGQMRQTQFQQQQTQFDQGQEDRQRQMMQNDLLPAAAAITMAEAEQRPALWGQIVPELKSKYPELANIPDQYDEAAFVRFLPQAFGPEASQKIIMERFAPKQTDLPNSAQEFKFAQAGGYKGSYQDWMREQKTQTQQFKVDHPTTPKVKPLPTPAVNKLAEAGTDLETLSRLNSSFKDEYGGHAILGDAVNTYGRLVGDDTGQAQWWQDYQGHVNEVRNRLFGSALTLPEKAEFYKAMVTPRMEAGEIRKNLARQAEIADRAARKLAKSYAAQGYSQEAIDELVPQTQAAPAPTGGGMPADITEDDIQETMRANGMTREEVLERLSSGG